MPRHTCSALLLVALIFSTSVITRAQQQAETECTPADLASSRLTRGMYAEVIADEPLTMRDDPSANSEPKGVLEPGTSVYIASDAHCQEGLLWWQVTPVNSQEYIFGWVAEQAQGTYQLAPVFQSLEVPQARQPITPQNLDELQQIASVDHNRPTKLAWSSDSSHLAVNTYRAVWVYDITANSSAPLQLPQVVREQLSGPGGIMMTDSQIATSGIPDGDLRITSYANSDQVIVDISSPDYAGVAAISPDLSRWATANKDGSIILWDTETGSRIALLNGHSLVGALAFSPDGKWLISGGGFDDYGFAEADTTLRVWDAASGALRAEFEFNSAPYEIALTADGTTIAVPDSSEASDPPIGDAVRLIDLVHMTSVLLPLQNALVRGDLSFSPDGTILAVTALRRNGGQHLLFLDTTDGQTIGTIEFDPILLDVQFSPDGTLLAIAHEGGMAPSANRVELWAVTDEQ